MFCSAPSTFQRKVIKDVTLGGVVLPKDTLIDMTWVNFLYNPSIFDNPLEFSPERWEKEETKKHQQLTTMIFSGGPRNCLGKSLAITEIKVFMIKVINRYENIIELGQKKR